MRHETRVIAAAAIFSSSFIIPHSSFAAAVPASGAEAARKPKALMIFFDGCRADALLRNADCPAFRSLIDGTWAEGYRCAWSDVGQNTFDAPTLSYPNHSALITGVTCVKHHVMKNDDVRVTKNPYPTWLSRIADAGKGWRVEAFFSDLNDSWISPATNVPMQVIEAANWRENDRITAERAAAALAREDGPDAAMFFTEDPDCTGHYCGYYPSSKEYLDALHACDAMVGKVLDAIRSRKTFDEEDWMITFTTDHGGKFLGHGPDDANCHTVPIVVAGRHVTHGRLPGCPRIFDVPVTLLAHFGLAAAELDGQVLGRGEYASAAAPSLDEGLFVRGTFDKPLPNLFDLALKPAKGKPCLTAYGYSGGLVVKDGFARLDEPNGYIGLRVEESAKVFEKPDFTIAFWLRDDGVMPKERPIVLSNRNFHNLENPGTSSTTVFPGFSVFYDTLMGDRMRGLALEVTGPDGTETRRIGAFLGERDKWTFYAVVARPDGMAVFYQGRSDGRFNWIAGPAKGATWASGLVLTFGQDAAGWYPTAKAMDLDDVAVWTRALTTAELDALYRRGRSDHRLAGRAADGVK